MIEHIAGAPEGVLAFRAVGKVEAADHATVLTPAIDETIASHGNGCSDLLVDVFGAGHARSAVGVGSLPFGMPVEIEAIFEVE